MWFYYLLKQIYFMEGLHDKINQTLNFEIWTFYRYIDLYRAYFLDTLTVQDFCYTT